MCPWSPRRQLGKCRAPKPPVHPTAPTNLSTDQQGSSVLPAKASKVQLKQAMVPWWQANNIKANQIISIMAKRGNTRGMAPSQTFVDSRRCTMDYLLRAVISCSGQLDRDSWETFGSLTYCSDFDLATEFFPSSPRNGSWRLTTAKTKSKQKGGERLIIW